MAGDEGARRHAASLPGVGRPCGPVALAAEREGIDIAGTLFRVGGCSRPTPAPATIRATGSTVFADYSMAEPRPRRGVACASPRTVGDVHLTLDQLALLQRPRVVPSSGEQVQAFVFTTLPPQLARSS